VAVRRREVIGLGFIGVLTTGAAVASLFATSAALIRENLFDEYRFCVVPVLLGAGTPLFKTSSERKRDEAAGNADTQVRWCHPFFASPIESEIPALTGADLATGVFPDLTVHHACLLLMIIAKTGTEASFPNVNARTCVCPQLPLSKSLRPTARATKGGAAFSSA
jgi:hypothetical protein